MLTGFLFGLEFIFSHDSNRKRIKYCIYAYIWKSCPVPSAREGCGGVELLRHPCITKAFAMRFLAQIKLWMSVSKSCRLSVTRALKHCRCASTSSAFENEGVARALSAPRSTQWGLELEGGPVCQGTQLAPCRGHTPHWFLSLLFWQLLRFFSILITFSFLSAGNHVQEQEKDPFPSLSLL